MNLIKQNETVEYTIYLVVVFLCLLQSSLTSGQKKFVGKGEMKG